MSYYIAEPCIGTKDTACVEVCPVDCIHPTKDEDNFEEVKQLYIEPDTCIDCGACEPVCPVTAIFPEEELPEKWNDYIGPERSVPPMSHQFGPLRTDVGREDLPMSGEGRERGYPCPCPAHRWRFSGLAFQPA